MNQWELQRKVFSRGKQKKRIAVDRMIGVYPGTDIYRFENVEILPFAVFRERLHSGEIFRRTVAQSVSDRYIYRWSARLRSFGYSAQCIFSVDSGFL